jgi:anti-sigma-K factor RskA
MLPTKHVLDVIPGYALDCLNEEEKLQVTEHLAQCASCQAELDSYRNIVDDLHEAVPLADPPPELKQKILMGVQPKRTAEKSEVMKPAWQRFWNKLQSGAPVWAYASFVLVIILAASNIWMLQRVNRLETNSQAEFRVVSLTGTDKAPNATGLLVISHDGNMGTLVVDSLPLLDGTHQYQLWLINKDNKRTSGGVFSVSQDGYGALAINASEPLKDFPAFGITIEPSGGSPGPTGPKVLGGKL